MKILVDADACPVKDIIVSEAKKYSVPVYMFVDTSHILKSGYACVITVDKASDSVDIALANKTERGDIVVTQDYGVAAMSLGKGAYALNQNGLVYTDKNIDMLLFDRHIGKKKRRAGEKCSGVKKRTDADDDNFCKELQKLLQIALKQ